MARSWMVTPTRIMIRAAEPVSAVSNDTHECTFSTSGLRPQSQQSMISVTYFGEHRSI
jgi:hypothetical protein